MHRLTFDEAAADLQREYAINGRRSAEGLERRIRLGLSPFFGGCRMVTITAADVRRYINERQEAGASAATINRELERPQADVFPRPERAAACLPMPCRISPRCARTTSARDSSSVRHSTRCARIYRPRCVRSSTFAYLTGWRMKSEIQPLEWRQVDWTGRVVRLEPGVAKNREGRTFPLHRRA